MEEEAARRNDEELTDEDVAKNLCWKVVGQRGEKRIVKGFSRGARGARTGTGAGQGAGAGPGTRGRGRGRSRWPARGVRGAGGRAGTRGSVWREGRETAKRTRNDSDSDPDQPPPTRPRGGTRGGYLWNSVATGANRTTITKSRNVEQEMDVVELDQEEEQEEESGDKLPMASQLNSMTPATGQAEEEPPTRQ